MNSKLSGSIIFIIVLATFITGTIVYPHVNNFRLAFGFPIILLILWGLWALFPRIDPIAKGFPGFRHIYDLVWVLVFALFAYSYALKLGVALGWQVNALHAVIPAIAILIFVTGMLLPHLKRNWFFGIRTPWTLSSNEDWDRTHRFGGPLFMIAGVIIFIGTFTPQTWSIWLLIGSILVVSVANILYSYFIYSWTK